MLSPVAPLPDISKLSPRQMEIVALLAEGKNARHIGTILSISPETVKTHITIACRKLEVSGRVGLIVTFVRWQTIQELNNDNTNLHRNGESKA